jgi:hypothetical protein
MDTPFDGQFSEELWAIEGQLKTNKMTEGK